MPRPPRSRSTVGRSVVGRRRPPRRQATGPLVFALVIVAALSTGLAWTIMKPSVAPPPPDPGVAGRSKDPTPSGAPLTPDPVSAEHERMQQTIIRDVPILTPEAARALLEDASRRGVPLGHPLDAGLFAAGRGFEGMDQASLDELTRLVAGVWEARSAAEVIRIQAYLQHARTGEPLSPGQVEAGRAMFTEGGCARSPRPFGNAWQIFLDERSRAGYSAGGRPRSARALRPSTPSRSTRRPPRQQRRHRRGGTPSSLRIRRGVPESRRAGSAASPRPPGAARVTGGAERRALERRSNGRRRG